MQKLLSGTFLLALLLGFTAILKAQPGILDPSDPDVVFTSTNQPPAPTWGRMSKWGHTNRLSWSGQRPFNYGYKSYYYKGIAFRLKFPKTYQHNVVDNKIYPVFIFLHGLGERGSIWDNEYQLLHGGQKHAQNVDNGNFDGFLLYTQSQNGFHNSSFPIISELIDSLVKHVKADIDRVIVSGLSSGGQSTWDFLADYSRDFAAGLPISAAQDEDMQYFNRYVTVPIWTANGGLDNNPTASGVTTVVNYFRSLGGNIRQTFYPTQGHGVWNSFWNQSDYFPVLNSYHKANPLVYFGRSEFCPNDQVNVQLGLHPGFNAYEWQKDGVTIPGATGNTYTATQYGTYRGRFKRTASSAWSEWSPVPVVVQQKAGTVTPPITINGLRSKVLPAPDGSTTVPLMVPDNYASYEWRRVSDNVQVGNANIYNAPVGQFKVQVTEQFGCSSSFSDPFTVINANGANKPDNPSNLSVSVVSNSALRLDWNDNPNPVHNETGFEIYRATSAGGPYTLIEITNPDVLTYTNSGLTPNTPYYYIVRAINNNGGSAATSEASATTASDTQAPTAPTDLRVTGTNRFSVSLDWEESTDDVGVVRYDIYVNGQKAYSTPESNFVVYNLTQGQTYTFAVKARDITNNLSPLSNQVTATALLTGLNYKYYEGSWSNLPNFTTLTPIKEGNSVNIDISLRNRNDNFAFLWEGNINITQAGNYTFRTRSDDGSRLWLGPLNGAASPYSFSGTPTVNNDGLHGAQDRNSVEMFLQAGSYPIAIAFFEAGGGESMSISWRTPSSGTSFVTIPNSAFTDAPPVIVPPVAPSNVVATAAGYDRINLTWTDNSSNESGFEIWRSTTHNANFITVGNVGSNVTSFTDSLLAPNTTYYYQVRSIGSTGESDPAPNFDLQARWKLDNNYDDESGNNKTLNANNGPTFLTDASEGSHSVNFDGSNDDLTINTTSNDYLTGTYEQKTIALWIRSDVVNSNRGIFDIGGSDDGLALRINANTLQAGVASNNTRRSISTPYNSTGWNHVALVYNRNSLKLYLNGVLVAQDNNLPFTSIGVTTNPSMIGDDNSSDALNTAFGQWDGKMDDFWILGSALDAAQINQIRNGNFAYQAAATTLPLPSAPAAPSSLTGNAVSTSSIQLSWNDNSSNETGFEIWRSVNNNTTYRLITTTGSNVNGFTDQGLFANVTYYYQVRAIGVGGNSAYSNEVNIATGNNAPVLATIASFTMRYDSEKILNLSATDADGESLTLLVQNLPAFATFNNSGNGSGQITFNPTVAQQGVYNIRVIANDQHNGADTMDFALTVNNNYVPVINAVSNVSIDENAQTSINLSATDQDGNASLQWNTTGLPAFATLTPGTNGAASLQLAPNFAQAGVYPVTLEVNDGAGGIGTYTFNVTVNNVEPSTNKWYVNIQYNQLTGGPAPWNNVNSLSAGNNLKDQNSQTTSVSLQFLTTAWNAFNGGAVTGNNSGVYPDNVLRDYYYFGIFGAPETVSFRLTGLDVSYKYNITLMAGSSWNGVADNGTTVFTINGVSQSLYTQHNTQNTVTFTSLSPDASGNITVQMSKAAGTPVGYLNAFVLEKIFDDGTAPVLPKDLAAVNNQNGSVKLTWTDVAYNELRYEVYRSTSENGTYTLLNPGATNNNATEYTDNSTQGLTTYWYKIAAVNNHGTSGLTNAVSITSLNKAPVVNVINNVYVKSGNSTVAAVVSSDDAGETLNVTVSNLPAFAEFVPNGNGTGNILIQPGLGDLGLYKDVVVTVTDNFGSSTSRTFDISVSDNQTRSIYVNLAGEFGSPQDKPWNNLVSYPFGGITLNSLKDDQDVTTSYGFRLVDGWTSSWQGGMITGNNSGIYPDNVIKTSIYEGSTNVKRIQFTGLNVNKRYNVAVFSSNNAGFSTSFTLSSGGQSLVFDGKYNSTRTVQLNGLVPNASGTIEFSITKAAGATYVFLNAVVLQEYDLTTTPVRPIELFTNINEPGKIAITWSDRSNNETGFEIWRATNGSAFSLLTTTAANVNSYTDNTAQPNIRYWYRVRAKNGVNLSTFSNTVDAKLGNNMIYVNFNLANPQAAPWNNTNGTPQEGVGINNLINTKGQATGASVVLTNNWGGYFDLGMTGGILPDNVMLNSWWIEGNSQPATFKLTNMDQSKRYRIGFMGSSSWDGDFTATYTINGRTVYLNSNKNNSKIVYIDNVTTNSDGEIQMTMGYLSATRWSFLSAIIVESYDVDSDNAGPLAPPPSGTITMSRGPVSETSTAAEKKEDIRILQNEIKVYPNPFDQSLDVNLVLQSEQRISIRIVDINGRLVMSKDLGRVKGVRNISLGSEVSQLIKGTYVMQVIADGKLEKAIKMVKLR